MNPITRNTDPLQGPPDGVTANIKCAITRFDDAGELVAHAIHDCKILCSYSEGMVQLALVGNMMVAVRVDELFAILKVASAAAQELAASVPAGNRDAELEARWRELADVPVEEADSPSGLILEESWWIFPKGADREEIWEYFDEFHSKGVAYLMGQTGEKKPH